MEQKPGFRKLTTILVTGVLVFGLQQFGLRPADLTAVGMEFGELRDALVHLLVQFGVPVVFMAAQPEERGDSLWRHWRWLVAGLGIIFAASAIVMLV